MATRRPGWQVLVAGIAAVYAYLGIASITLPDQPGSWGTLGGTIALVASAAYLVAGALPRRGVRIPAAAAPAIEHQFVVTRKARPIRTGPGLAEQEEGRWRRWQRMRRLRTSDRMVAEGGGRAARRGLRRRTARHGSRPPRCGSWWSPAEGATDREDLVAALATF